MTDPRIEAWARTLVTYSTRVQPGDVVSIEGDVSTRPLLAALYRETLRAGGLPTVIPRLGELNAELLNLGSDEQLTWLSPVDCWSRGEADVLIRVLGEENTKALTGVDPDRQIMRKRSQSANADDDGACGRGRVQVDIDALPNERLRPGRRTLDE